MSFGEQLKCRRKELGLSRSELAKQLGVSQSAVGNYETGVSAPKEEILLRIFDIWSNRHQALYIYMRQCCHRFHKRKNFFCFQAEFTLLLCYIYFNKYRNCHIMFCSFIFNCFCKSQRIYRMNQCNLVYNIFYFISLQMSDHMPANI